MKKTYEKWSIKGILIVLIITLSPTIFSGIKNIVNAPQKAVLKELKVIQKSLNKKVDAADAFSYTNLGLNWVTEMNKENTDPLSVAKHESDMSRIEAKYNQPK